MGLGKEVPGETTDKDLSCLEGLLTVSGTMTDKLPEMDVKSDQVKSATLGKKGESGAKKKKYWSLVRKTLVFWEMMEFDRLSPQCATGLRS